LLLPGHPAYEEARLVLNPSIDKRPALIVQPKGSADVKNAVDFARGSNLLVAVKCGGHSLSGKSTCDGGMMIDLSTLRSVRVDPAARIAHVSGGSLLGDMDHDTMAFGLVTTAGTVSHTGVGGLTLGGGFGRVARRFGLALDNVRGVDVVTAGGELLHANAEENADLYWAVRGGGGNFGVVTQFEFALHPMDRQVIGGNIIFPLSEAKRVLTFYAEYGLEAPDELYMDCGMFNEPGQGSGVLFHVCYSGPKDRAESILGKLRGIATPVADTVQPIDYVAIQKSSDVTDPRAIGSYTKTGFCSELSAEMIAAMVDGFGASPELPAGMYFQHGGGAIGRVPATATAFPHRHARFTPLAETHWAMGSDPSAHIAWIRKYWAAIEPHTEGFYTNEVDDHSQSQVDRNYMGNFDRLLALKNRYDPTNLFRLNANIVPTV
jgi:FAD/FMN-containing dehydrogenase